MLLPLVALLPLAFGFMAPLALGGLLPKHDMSQVVVALMTIPIAVYSWHVWRGRDNHPVWAWRGALVLAVVAIVALIVSAVAVLVGP
jgi:hypothetical protein